MTLISKGEDMGFAVIEKVWIKCEQCHKTAGATDGRYVPSGWYNLSYLQEETMRCDECGRVIYDDWWFCSWNCVKQWNGERAKGQK
jgi:hypothetical protein